MDNVLNSSSNLEPLLINASQHFCPTKFTSLLPLHLSPPLSHLFSTMSSLISIMTLSAYKKNYSRIFPVINADNGL